MTPIDFITIQADVLYRDDLNPTEKLVLGLVQSFNGKGLIIGNDEIARLASVRADTVSKILTKLHTRNLIEIVNPQSRHRRIYFGENAKVENESTLENNPTTLDSRPIYLGIQSKHNLKKGKKRRAPAPFSPPLADEVTAYGNSIGYAIDGEKFCDYYQAQGWMVGKHRMRDWQAKVRNWKTRDDQQGGGGDNGRMMPTCEVTEAVADELLKGFKP